MSMIASVYRPSDMLDVEFRIKLLCKLSTNNRACQGVHEFDFCMIVCQDSSFIDMPRSL